jgi:hypothetical protein
MDRVPYCLLGTVVVVALPILPEAQFTVMMFVVLDESVFTRM